MQGRDTVERLISRQCGLGSHSKWLPGRQRCAEQSDGWVKPTEANVIIPPTNLETDVLLAEVQGGFNLLRLVHAPNLIKGPGRAQERDRRIELERELGDLVRRKVPQLGRIEGRTYFSVPGRVQGPFESGHVREVHEVATRWKSRQE